MDNKYFAEKFVNHFPEHRASYQEHLDDYDKVLGHVFFGDTINQVLYELLMKNHDIQQIQKYISFINDMYVNGNDADKNVVEVTILAYLGDNDISLKNAFAYFSDDLLQASKKIETLLRRRNIRIYRKRGKTYANW